ncbi:MAG: TetR family transcriptional regulator C-terminal domain-containing protein, partial [Nevskiales bacterium]
NQIVQDWRQGVIEVTTRAQLKGQVRKDVDPAAVAAFVISSIEGCVGVGKATQSREFLEAGFRGLIDYLEHLRPEPREH